MISIRIWDQNIPGSTRPVLQSLSPVSYAYLVFFYPRSCSHLANYDSNVVSSCIKSELVDGTSKLMLVWLMWWTLLRQLRQFRQLFREFIFCLYHSYKMIYVSLDMVRLLCECMCSFHSSLICSQLSRLEPLIGGTAQMTPWTFE